MAENLRQFFHLLFGSTIIIMLIFFGQKTALAVSITAFVFGLALSHSIKNGLKIKPLEALLKKVERESEKSFPGYGALTLFFGISITLVFAQKYEVALGAISVLTFGDAFSNIVGTNFGKIKVGKRYTIEGTIGGMLAAFIALATYLDPFTALIAGVTGMLFEFLGFEDNLLIPIGAGAALTLLL